jgi:hypothetical protein
VCQDPELIPGKLSSCFAAGLTTIKSNELIGWVFGTLGVPRAPFIAYPELRREVEYGNCQTAGWR